MQGRAGRGGKADRAASKANKWASQQASPNHQLLLFLMCQVHTSKQAIAQGNKSDSHPKREAGQPASLAKPSATPSCFSSAKPRQMHRRRGKHIKQSLNKIKWASQQASPNHQLPFLFLVCQAPKHAQAPKRSKRGSASSLPNKQMACKPGSLAKPSAILFCRLLGANAKASEQAGKVRGKPTRRSKEDKHGKTN